MNETSPPTSKEACYFNSRTELRKSLTTSWLYTSRYLLPVLGGMLSSAWLGCNRVLQIGGNVMLLSTVLLSLAVQLGLMCRASPIIPIAWALLPVFYGLIQPNILFAIFCWHRRDRLRTVLTTTYYVFAIIGEMVSMPFMYRYFASETTLGHKFSLVFVAVSLAFMVLTAFMPQVREEESFQLPTNRRMLKYFQIFSALILFLIFEGDERSTVYKNELTYILNGNLGIAEQTWLSPEYIKCISFVVLSLPLIIVSALSRQPLAVKPRILSGIMLKCAVELCLAIVTFLGMASSTGVMVIYAVMSVLDGAAELLVMVAAYDLGCSLLPTSSQCLILGVMYTVRGLSNFVSRGLFQISVEISKLHIGSKPLFFIYHLIAVLMLTGCFLHHKFVTLPIADQMILPTEDDETDGTIQCHHVNDINPDPELQPLLERA